MRAKSSKGKTCIRTLGCRSAPLRLNAMARLLPGLFFHLILVNRVPIRPNWRAWLYYGRCNSWKCTDRTKAFQELAQFGFRCRRCLFRVCLSLLRMPFPLDHIEGHSISPDLIRRHAELATLITLITVESTLCDPLAINSRHFLDCSYARNLVITIWISQERHRKPTASDEKFLWSRLYDDHRPSSVRRVFAGHERDSVASKRKPPRAIVYVGLGLAACSTNPRVCPDVCAGSNISEKSSSAAYVCSMAGAAPE